MLLPYKESLLALEGADPTGCGFVFCRKTKLNRMPMAKAKKVKLLFFWHLLVLPLLFTVIFVEDQAVFPDPI
ncbi:hypothetical protein [Shewanella surugensis]|uniref:Uncharacterized protein n=1 Tax=Shewanella surugensis TaxID=212020 RepID=A0ABT0L5S0_9GAMM|nr:hypothetical protein [Shewanella surugensis]MCL1123038.1 hypothetical protein [Shewanella surugensis]